MILNLKWLLLCLLIIGCESKKDNVSVSGLYPDITSREISKEHAVYYIDPNVGSDDNSGIEKSAPWKTFKKVNQLVLRKGNKLEILSAGSFRESLFLIGRGTIEDPIIVQFAPGTYNFYPENAVKEKFHISNTNDDPGSLKAIAFYFLNTENIKVKGNGADIVFRGKVIETSLNNCKNIQIENLSFDYKRPTVSEMKVVNETEHYVDVQIHEDSDYEISNDTLFWVGERWKHKAQKLWQVFNAETQIVKRINFPVEKMHFSELGNKQVRISFDENPGFNKGMIYQNRNTFRDYCGVFMQKSKNIIWKNVTVNFMHGMGFVSQFCENITFDGLQVRPKENSGRTCAAWADILHFSGCKGEVVVENSYLSAANDDAINVHGTHLRIIETISKRKIKVKFMHHQSYGFQAFYKGDQIAFINASTLLPYSNNEVKEVVQLNAKEFKLTLTSDVPTNIQEKDVIENRSWTANVTIRNNKITHIPTRGILLTTSGKILVENNEFLKTNMSAVLIADDANGWYESGYVKDVTVRNNSFIDCGSPVINIHPENSEVVKESPVHSNIVIDHNLFKIEKGQVLAARSTGGLKFVENAIESKEDFVFSSLYTLKDCIGVDIQESK